MSVQFPIPSFLSPEAMVNAWTYRESQSSSVHLDDSNRLVVNKLGKSAMNLVHHGEVEDLKSLRSGFGVEIEHAKAYTVYLDADVVDGLRVELVLNEYDSLGERLTRNLIEIGARTLYVPSERVDRVLLSIRFAGQGSATLKKVEFTGVADLEKAIPGLYPYGSAPVTQTYKPSDGSFRDLRKFLTSDRKYLDAVAKASAAEITDRLSVLEKNNAELKDEIRKLHIENEMTQETLSHLNKLVSSLVFEKHLSFLE